ncbi:MAG: hypothetical protein IPO17_16590 [Flavobacteriales bacterium]|nr:hypothetical protein [Flavobacteriales bacterium]
MKNLLTCLFVFAATCASAQKSPLSWGDLERLAALDLSGFEKEVEDMGLTPHRPDNTSTPECVTLVYLGATTANGSRNKLSTMRCSDGLRTVAFNTADEETYKKVKEAAIAKGFKLQAAEAGAPADVQVHTHDGKQMRTDRSVVNGTTYFVISLSGTWPK